MTLHELAIPEEPEHWLEMAIGVQVTEPRLLAKVGGEEWQVARFDHLRCT